MTIQIEGHQISMGDETGDLATSRIGTGAM